MKQLTQRTLSLILALSMVLALSVPTFAYSRAPEIFDDDITQEEIDALREAYSTLSPEAKETYLASLYQDPEALAFHRQYIDSSFNSRALSYGLCYANAAVANAANADVVTNLVRQLQAIQGMPPELVNAFRIMASGMVADMADGPLPFGAIITAAGAAAVVVIIANNWEKVSPLFPRIVAAFKQAFSDSANQIVSAFNTLKAEAKQKAEEKKEEQKKDYEKAKKNGEKTKNHTTQNGRNLPVDGEPYSSTDLVDSNGIKQRRYYGKDGKADMDIDYRHSGNEHPFPHRHDWVNGRRGNAY